MFAAQPQLLSDQQQFPGMNNYAQIAQYYNGSTQDMSLAPPPGFYPPRRDTPDFNVESLPMDGAAPISANVPQNSMSFLSIDNQYIATPSSANNTAMTTPVSPIASAHLSSTTDLYSTNSSFLSNDSYTNIDDPTMTYEYQQPIQQQPQQQFVYDEEDSPQSTHSSHGQFSDDEEQYHAGYDLSTPQQPQYYQFQPNSASSSPTNSYLATPQLNTARRARRSTVGPSSSSSAGGKAVQCRICKKYFKRDLPRHMRTHEEVARFVCPFPRKHCSHKRGQFNRPYDFKKHLLHAHFMFDNPNVRSYKDLRSKLDATGACLCGHRFKADNWIDVHILGEDKSQCCPTLQAYWAEEASSNPAALDSIPQPQMYTAQMVPPHEVAKMVAHANAKNNFQ
ncbi:hypothetical protein TRVA0_024S00848 [Trichomonascus vanleenenianus]|uniref:uncharacterized protein n=1 Tax=Trichomonascus vanleenenianus TaxID=2268995 RepID=UPI003EC968BA